MSKYNSNNKSTVLATKALEMTSPTAVTISQILMATNTVTVVVTKVEFDNNTL